VLAVPRGATFAQSMPDPAMLVKTSTYVSLDPVPRGQTFEAAIRIQPGYHMNPHTPSEDYPIPATITVNTPAAITVVGTAYPEGQLKTFAFSPNKSLSVYTDSVTLRMKLTADSGVAAGPLSIPATLRYQACNDQACLPPVRVPVVLNAKCRSRRN
jgi:Disulphide bond corrector protein DsbC